MAGYDGSNRINDFYEFDFGRRQWAIVPAVGAAPSPRDRHVAVVYRDSFFVFAGFDGSSRVNDFIEYNFRTRCLPSAFRKLLCNHTDAGLGAPVTQRWSPVVVNGGLPPSPRHSHAAVVYGVCCGRSICAIGCAMR